MHSTATPPHAPCRSPLASPVPPFPCSPPNTHLRRPAAPETNLFLSAAPTSGARRHLKRQIRMATQAPYHSRPPPRLPTAHSHSHHYRLLCPHKFMNRAPPLQNRDPHRAFAAAAESHTSPSYSTTPPLVRAIRFLSLSLSLSLILKRVIYFSRSPVRLGANHWACPHKLLC
jgi:hypothetical protein